MGCQKRMHREGCGRTSEKNFRTGTLEPKLNTGFPKFEAIVFNHSRTMFQVCRCARASQKKKQRDQEQTHKWCNRLIINVTKLVNDYCTLNTPDVANFTSPIYLASQSRDRQWTIYNLLTFVSPRLINTHRWSLRDHKGIWSGKTPPEIKIHFQKCNRHGNPWAGS